MGFCNLVLYGSKMRLVKIYTINKKKLQVKKANKKPGVCKIQWINILKGFIYNSITPILYSIESMTSAAITKPTWSPVLAPMAFIRKQFLGLHFRPYFYITLADTGWTEIPVAPVRTERTILKNWLGTKVLGMKQE